MGRLLLLALCLLPASARAQTVSEQYLVSAMNEERAAHQLQPLRIDPALVRAAMLHAERMARHGTISHQFAEEPELTARAFAAGAHFSHVAENVAEGPSPIGVHDALMRSPGHRANILDPAMDTVGVAVLVRHGHLYAVEDFARAVAPISLKEQEAAVALQLDRAGLELVASADARRTCALASGYTGDERPNFVMRYTTDDLTQLPEALTRRLRSGHDRRAAVGACAQTASRFSQYNIAILLFR